MKDKEKQIEEMAKDLYGEIDYDVNYYSDDNYSEVDFDYKETAKNIVEKGWVKLPKDSVVISKEEYDEIKTYQSYISEMKKAFDKIRIATIKETAREILNELIDSSNKITFFDCRMALGLDKLAKKYGLEIKE